MSDRTRIPDQLVRPTEIKRWARRDTAIGKQIAKLEQERGLIRTMIAAAKGLSPKEARAEPSPRKRVARQVRSSAPPQPIPVAGEQPKKVRKKQPEKSQWKAIVREIALTSPRPVSYREARDEIKKSPLGPLLEQSDKGFFYAISKLSKAGEIVSHKGHLLSPQLYAQFRSDLAAGRVRDLRMENTAHNSPMGDAVIAMMSSRRNGAESGHIIWELKKNPEFKSIIEKNKTHPYNVLARLVRIGELTKRGKRYFSTSQKTEAPSLKEGASTAIGESGVSPSDSREGGPTTLFG